MIPKWRVKVWTEKYGHRWLTCGGNTELEARGDALVRFPYYTKVVEISYQCKLRRKPNV